MLVSNWYRHMGRWFKVQHVAANADEANAYMTAHPDTGLLAELDDGRAVIAAMNDTGKPTLTRADYMDADRSNPGDGQRIHDAYYGQFATPAVVRFVGDVIGKATIKASTDPHFNDIPLIRWDRLDGAIRSMVGATLREANDGVSLSDTVCVAKAAARVIKGAS